MSKTVSIVTSDFLDGVSLYPLNGKLIVNDLTKIPYTFMGVANGVPTLDANGKVTASQLPTLSQSVVAYNTFVDFPRPGAANTIYIALDTNQMFNWNGQFYSGLSATVGNSDLITEGVVNLFYTDERARNAISVSGSLSYDPTTGVISSSGAASGSTTIGTTLVTLGSTVTALAGLSSITLTADPTSAMQAVTKQYVDAAIANINYQPSVRAATTLNLAAAYTAPAGANGARLTSSANGALIVDGYTMALNERVLVKNQTIQSQNGVYVAKVLGSATVPWVLERATDYDNASEISSGDFFFVVNGTVNAATSWIQVTDGAITLGTTNLVYTQVGAVTSYSVGTGLSLNGTQFALSNTTVAPAAYGSASKTLTLTVNAQGQITQASATDISINISQVTGTIAAASATAVNIVDDISTASTVYPTWVTSTSGNQGERTSSTKLKFNPSTGVLTATGGISAGTF